jgi:hypothetical protein|tara:strand:+ start:333 stop:557 length:225 start_codon:yes stop_codon:yes gene_type:complete
MSLISGQKITELYSINSWYSDNKIAGKLDTGETIRIDTDVILQMVNDYIFKGKKARVHLHLTEPKQIDVVDGSW